MTVISISIYLLINSFFTQTKGIEIPIIYVANKLGVLGRYIYGMVILFAIFTTAISTGYSFLVNVTNSRKRYLKIAIAICIISIFIGQMGFSNLITFLYPIFGYLGTIQIIFLLIS